MNTNKSCAENCYSASNFNQLCQDFDRLNEKMEGVKVALGEYYFSELPISYSVSELVAGYKDRNQSAANFMQQLNETEQERDDWREKYLALKKACDEAEPVYVIFDGPPGPNPPAFIEVETEDGKSVRAGGWSPDQDGTWKLGPLFTSPPNTAEIEQRVAEACRKAVLSEHLEAPTNEADDIAYDNAIAANGRVDRVVRPGSRWLHTNGNTYTVLHLANEHADDAKRDEYPLTIVYRGPDQRVWAKALEAFLHSRSELLECEKHVWDMERECCAVCGTDAWTT